MRGLLAVVFVASTLSVAHAAEPADSLKTCISGRAEDALDACQRVIVDASASSGERAQAFYARSTRHNVSGNLDQALADIDEAISLGGRHSNWLTSRATTLSLLKQHSAAILEATEALQLKPDNLEALVVRGLVYADSGQHQLAITDYSGAIQLRATSAMHRLRAVSHAAVGDMKSARADLAEALRLPDSNTLYGRAHELARAELAKLPAEEEAPRLAVIPVVVAPAVTAKAPVTPVKPETVKPETVKPEVPGPSVKPKLKAPVAAEHAKEPPVARKAEPPCRIGGRYSSWVAAPDRSCGHKLPKEFW